jgi:hypothetical protein
VARPSVEREHIRALRALRDAFGADQVTVTVVTEHPRPEAQRSRDRDRRDRDEQPSLWTA